MLAVTSSRPRRDDGHSLSIPLYVKRAKADTGKPEDQRSLREVWDDWEQDGRAFWQQMDALIERWMD